MKEFLEAEPDPAFARRAEIIFENLELKNGDSVVDIGCGRGFYVNLLSQLNLGLEIFGLDLNEKYLKVARESLNGKKVFLKKGNALKLPFKSNSFDKVIASEILEHLNDDKKAIAEIYRVLKPGGIALISVPNKNYPFLWDPLNCVLERFLGKHIPSNIWWLAGIWADHVRLYNEKELRDKMKKKGFKVEKVWYATHCCFPFSHFLFYGIGKNLIERGLFPSCNRFSGHLKPTRLRKILFWPILKVDSFNEKVVKTTSVNLVLKVVKEDGKKQKEGNDILD